MRLALQGVIILLVAGIGDLALCDEPTRQWRTLSTPHFKIHYYQDLRANESLIARRVATIAEEVHETLAPVYRHTPAEPTHIVIRDTVDSANGSASVIPYNVVRIFVTAPTSRSTLNDYDDWLRLLIVHEYTHILHLDTIHGLPRWVNALMGKVWAPNQVQPRWIIEGLAVHEETKRTSGGRNRSAIFDMYLRMAVLNGEFLALDQISSATFKFPRGSVPYLYGGRFFEYLAQRFGQDKLAAMSHRYGSMPLPYSLNRVALRVFGRSYEALYDDFRRYLQRRYQRQKDRVKRRGLRPGVRVTDHGWFVDRPRYSQDGRQVVYIVRDGKSHAAFRVLNPTTRTVREEYLDLGGSSVDPSPDNRFLVYGQAVNWRTFHAFHDLYVKRRNDGQVRRLTTGRRTRDPAFSPDGRQIVFVSAHLGENRLEIIPFVGGQSTLLLQGGHGTQYYAPRFGPSGRRIVFSRWRCGGYRDIRVFDRDTGITTQITNDRALDMDPVFSADGKRIYFSSDRSGVFNIYAYDLARRQIMQVTNVLGGAFSPAVSPDERELYYVGFSTKGYDLYRMSLRPAAYRLARPYINDRPTQMENLTCELDRPPIAYRDESYSPWSTLLPRSWSLSLGSAQRTANLTVRVSGNDVVGRHAYTALATMDSSAGDLSYNLAYSYRRFWPTLTLSTGRSVAPRGGLVIDGRPQLYREENYAASATLTLPALRMPDHSVNLALAYRLNRFRNADKAAVLVLPDEITPNLPETGLLSGIALTLSYSNRERYLDSISSERGRGIGFILQVDNSMFGSDFRNTRATWSWSEYLPIPWFDNHVLALRYGGGIASGDFKRRGLFSLGGFPDQNIIQSIVDQVSIGGVFLRGFAPGSFIGRRFHLGNIEYRLPLLSLERGLSTLPIYLNRIHAAVFADFGDASFESPTLSGLKIGVGGEIMIDWSIAYFVPFMLRAGYARGVRGANSGNFFFLLGNRF